MSGSRDDDDMYFHKKAKGNVWLDDETEILVQFYSEGMLALSAYEIPSSCTSESLLIQPRNVFSILLLMILYQFNFPFN